MRGFIIGFFLLVFSSVGLWAQTTVRFRHLGLADGLSHSLVGSIVQDDMGFIWIATQDGINRYDGYHFELLYPDGSSRRPSQNWASILYKDRHGFIWFYYMGGGLELYNPKTGLFRNFEASDEGQNGLSSVSFGNVLDTEKESFFEDSKGRLWLATNKGANYYNYDNKSFTCIAEKDGLSDNNVSCFSENIEGQILIGTKAGLNSYDPKTETVKQLLPKLLSDKTVTAIQVDDFQRIWVGTLRHGLYCLSLNAQGEYQSRQVVYNNLYERGASEATIFCLAIDRQKRLLIGTSNGLAYAYCNSPKLPGMSFLEDTIFQNYEVRFLYQDSRNNIWLGGNRRQTGLLRLDSRLHLTDVFKHQPNQADKLSARKTNCIFEDSSGMLWIGTEKGGINLVNLYAQPFDWLYTQSSPLALNSNDVYAIYQNTQNDLWVGTLKGLNKLNFKTNTSKVYQFGQSRKPMGMLKQESSEMAFNMISCIEAYTDGRLWLGAFDYKVSLMDTAKEQFTNFLHTEDSSGRFDIWSVRTICVTEKGEAYFGGTNGGLHQYLPESQTFRSFPVVETNKPGGTNDLYINCIVEDHRGLLWIGTHSKGLNCYDPEKEEFKHWVNLPKQPGSLSSNLIRCIHVPEVYRPNELLWIGTTNGLNCFDRKTQMFKHYQWPKAVPQSTVHAILEDKHGRLWLSTNKGLICFNPQSGDVRVYTQQDGLQSNEFNQGACFKADDGRFYFGGVNGITAFYPDSIRENQNKPQLVFTSFRLANQIVLPGDTVNGRVMLSQHINYTEHLTLTPDEKVVSFGVVAIDYAAPQKIRYRYKLEGFDNSWGILNPGNQNITYTNIPPGEYRLKVMASNSNNSWNGPVRILKIKVLPPFWQTNWFRITMALILTVLVILVLSLRTQMLRQQKRELEKQVEKRVAELKQKSEQLIISQQEIAKHRDNLQQQNKLLERQKNEMQKMADQLKKANEQRLQFYTNISHELRTPLSLILGPTEKLLQTDIAADKSNIKAELQLIYQNEKKLLHLINQLLELRRIESDTLALQVSYGNIVPVLHNLYELFDLLAKRQNIDYQFAVSHEDISAFFDPDFIEKIVSNLLSNAFKYTPSGGHIALTADREKHLSGERIVLRISDTGQGIAPERIPYIFNRFYKNEAHAQSFQGSSGIGLSLVKDLVKRHHGGIRVDSRLGQGSTFLVYIPAEKDKYSQEEIAGSATDRQANWTYTRQMIELQPRIENQNHTDVFAAINSPEKGRYKLLIVEDNLQLCQFIARELGDSYQVLLAYDGQEGLDIAHAEMPDLIISDVMMPRKDGLQLLKELRQIPDVCHIPVLLLTARSADEDQLAGLKIGANDYITKPFSLDVIKLKIQNLLKLRHQWAERFWQTPGLDLPPANLSSFDQKLLDQILKTIKEEIENPELNSRLIAERVAMSKSKLYIKLKALTGMTVNNFIRTTRLKMAARLLDQKDLQIAEVAYKLGFNDPKYFSRAFTQQFGCSPKDYKERPES